MDFGSKGYARRISVALKGVRARGSLSVLSQMAHGLKGGTDMSTRYLLLHSIKKVFK